MEIGSTGRDICVLTDNQSCLKALQNIKTRQNRELECYEALKSLAILIWVPEDSGIKGNDVTDEAARAWTSVRYYDPEPFIPISQSCANAAVWGWSNERVE